MKTYLYVAISLLCSSLFSAHPQTSQKNDFPSELDKRLHLLIKKNNLKPLDPLAQPPRPLVRLGAHLFRESALSGHKNISCMHCHHPMQGTSDGVALSLGQGSEGFGHGRHESAGAILKRNSPALINLGYPEITEMFWDGRLSYNPHTDTYETPEKALNGNSPKAKRITQKLSGALSAQALFPILSRDEMRGHRGNDLAEKESALEVWEAVMSRLTEGEKKQRYLEMFSSAYPDDDVQQLNIGHVGTALAAFMKKSFNFVDTPYDRYLRGNLNALTREEKRGMNVFLGRGQCFQCHNGPHLSNFSYRTVGVPQIAKRGNPNLADKGRFEVTGSPSDQFKFKTPPLRNVAVTAPYMHNGTFSTLEEVVEHYDQIKQSLQNYEISEGLKQPYTSALEVDRDPRRNKLRFQLISIGEVRRGLNLTEEEKKDLLQFLKTGILDYRFQRSRKKP